MRITDARTGEHAEIRPRRAGLLRVAVAVGVQDHRFDLADLRALLAGDVLARTCEVQGVQVFIELVVPDSSDDQVRTLLSAADQLGIHPPAQLSTCHEADDGGRVAADVVVTSRPHRRPGTRSPVVLVTGPVSAELSNGSLELPADLSDISPAPEYDPFALRLVFLEHAVTDPVRLTAAALTDAAGRLSRWRSFVADLACVPSGSLDADMVQASFDGLNEGLDARVALRALRALEERADLPDGTRFETCVRLDQILALELARDIGRRAR
ncbi:hypothetical protein ACFU7Y_31040 [Kitasatospora sp. NPDC057542]|uniref:hypothetical protein n=1 Tax=Streptomycetaceae TaxID=2062 RepID=UPI001CCA5AFD|nr:hypothetical protein [Streptomyces sp. LS1784]